MNNPWRPLAKYDFGQRLCGSLIVRRKNLVKVELWETTLFDSEAKINVFQKKSLKGVVSKGPEK